jgi:hypothetical protein
MSPNNANKQLNDLLISRNFEPQALNNQGKPAPSPDDAVMFSFDYSAESGNDYGTVVIMIDDDHNLNVYFGDNLGKGMESEDKQSWFDFLYQIRQFAKRNMMTFSIQDLNKLKYSMKGQAALAEGLFESWAGKRDVSYNADATQARLMIKHKRAIGEGEARFRYVESLFIETVDGERYRMPFKSLSAGRAMLEHVRQGGKPYDVRGQHIATIVNEMSLLSRFKRANQGKIFEGETQQLVEEATHYYETLQKNLKSLATKTGYTKYFESWNPADITDEDVIIEDLRHLFVEQNIDSRVEQALPLLAKLKQEHAMKEINVFESWMNLLSEGTWALPDTKEKQTQLITLLSQELPVGADATNATEQLYDILGDDELFDKLNDLAQQDANADARTVILDRLEQMKDNPDIAQVIGKLKIETNPAEQPDQEPVQEGETCHVCHESKCACDHDQIDEGHEECRYCGGNCPNDEEHACDGYLGDIDHLYADDKVDEDMFGLNDLQKLAGFGNEMSAAKSPNSSALDLRRGISKSVGQDYDDSNKKTTTPTDGGGGGDWTGTKGGFGTPVDEEKDDVEEGAIGSIAGKTIGKKLGTLAGVVGSNAAKKAGVNIGKMALGRAGSKAGQAIGQELGDVAGTAVANKIKSKFRPGNREETEEGWKGQLAGGTAGTIAGELAGTALMPGIGTMVGGALGGIAGQMIGDKLGGPAEPEETDEGVLGTVGGAMGGGYLGTLAGGALGAAMGGPAGAALGATAGGEIGRAAGAVGGQEMTKGGSSLIEKDGDVMFKDQERLDRLESLRSFAKAVGNTAKAEELDRQIKKIYADNPVGSRDDGHLEELSPQTLGSYAKKASGQAQHHIAAAHMPSYSRDERDAHFDKSDQRRIGTKRAIDKLTAKALSESGMSEADILFQEIARGNVDIYDIYAHPKTNIEKFVSDQIHEKYEEVAREQGYHLDDDVEQILDRIQRELEVEYGTDDNMDIDMDETVGGGNWLEEEIDQKGALKAAQDAAKFILRNLDDRAALKDYSMHFWSPTKFYQGATMADRGVGVDEIVKHIIQDRPAQFEESTALTGQYGHSGKLQAVTAQDNDMMDRIKFLAGITK